MYLYGCKTDRLLLGEVVEKVDESFHLDLETYPKALCGLDPWGLLWLLSLMRLLLAGTIEMKEVVERVEGEGR